MSAPNSLLDAALADEAAGNTSDVPATALASDTVFKDVFAATDTFWSAWQLLNLPDADRARTVAVMHGVATEPRHPAYRVTPTGDPGIYECRAGRTVALTLRIHLAEGAEPTGDLLDAPGAQVWLTVRST